LLSAFALLGLTALPYTLTAPGWLSKEHSSLMYWIPFLPAQSLLLAGFLRHNLNVGDISLESQLPWVKAIYPLGLILLTLIQILLGLWGWEGARQLGLWWAALIALGLAALLAWIAIKFLTRLAMPATSSRWGDILRLDWLYRAAWAIYRFLGQVSTVITSTLEGDGGVLWSFVILILVLSLLTLGI
jgi:hypothetical protein